MTDDKSLSVVIRGSRRNKEKKMCTRSIQLWTMMTKQATAGYEGRDS